MLILLRSYSFIPDVARVTSEPRANIKVFASGIVRLLPPTWKEREREREISSLSREPSGTFYFHALLSQSLLPFLFSYRFFPPYNSRQSGLASYRNPPIQISETPRENN